MSKPPFRERRWAVFISGRGSNLQAILDLAGEANVRKVVSSKADAPGVRRARRHGVPVQILAKKIDWALLSRDLRAGGITNLFLCGFMKIVPAEFVAEWRGRILNVHPSLLPAYPGLRSFERAFEDGADVGVTVHVVTEEMDAGPRISRARAIGAKAREGGMAASEAQRRLSLVEQRLVREAVQRWRA